MSELSRTDQTMFAMVRRGGLGASDASVCLGINIWTTIDDLIEEKRSVGLTAKEIEVGNKENVRKGRDLEPIILQKFQETMGLTVEKPMPMYRLKEHPQLTINFDGVAILGEQPIPVEAKLVSAYATKYWDKTKRILNWYDGTPMLTGGATIQEHIKEEAALYGIPDYYYTQIQQQILGLDAPYGYLTVIFDKGWESCTFKIFKDAYMHECLIKESAILWHKIKALN